MMGRVRTDGVGRTALAVSAITVAVVGGLGLADRARLDGGPSHRGGHTRDPSPPRRPRTVRRRRRPAGPRDHDRHRPARGAARAGSRPAPTRSRSPATPSTRRRTTTTRPATLRRLRHRRSSRRRTVRSAGRRPSTGGSRTRTSARTVAGSPSRWSGSTASATTARTSRRSPSRAGDRVRFGAGARHGGRDRLGGGHGLSPALRTQPGRVRSGRLVRAPRGRVAVPLPPSTGRRGWTPSRPSRCGAGTGRNGCPTQARRLPLRRRRVRPGRRPRRTQAGAGRRPGCASTRPARLARPTPCASRTGTRAPAGR